MTEQDSLEISLSVACSLILRTHFQGPGIDRSDGFNLVSVLVGKSDGTLARKLLLAGCEDGAGEGRECAMYF